jgi:hypothetical protein
VTTPPTEPHGDNTTGVDQLSVWRIAEDLMRQSPGSTFEVPDAPHGQHIALVQYVADRLAADATKKLATKPNTASGEALTPPEPLDEIRARYLSRLALAQRLFEAEFELCGGRMPADPTWEDLADDQRAQFITEARRCEHVHREEIARLRERITNLERTLSDVAKAGEATHQAEVGGLQARIRKALAICCEWTDDDDSAALLRRVESALSASRSSLPAEATPDGPSETASDLARDATQQVGLSASGVPTPTPACGCDPGDSWFDRELCPEPCGTMHTRCRAHGAVLDRCVHEATPTPEQAVPPLGADCQYCHHTANWHSRGGNGRCQMRAGEIGCGCEAFIRGPQPGDTVRGMDRLCDGVLVTGEFVEFGGVGRNAIILTPERPRLLRAATVEVVSRKEQQA